MANENYVLSTLDLEVLAILANSRRPVRYIDFVNKPDRNLLANAMDLAKLGLVTSLSVDEIRNRGYSVEDLCDGIDIRDAGAFLCDGIGDISDAGAFYEISEHGKSVVDGMLNYANFCKEILSV